MNPEFSNNYFQLFGLRQQFSISLDELTQKYRELQQAVHPDRFASASDQERRLSMQKATLINEAFQALKDPLLRARYLLELAGLTWTDEKNTVADSGFLMQQMELREMLEEIPGANEPLDEVANFVDRVTAQERDLIGLLSRQLESREGQALHEAQDTIRKLQFFKKLKSEAETLELELEDHLH